MAPMTQIKRLTLMEINRAEQRQCNREQRSSVHNMNNAVTASLHNSLGQKNPNQGKQ